MLTTCFRISTNQLTPVINKLAPLRHPNKNIIRNRTKPWITRGLRNSIKKKTQFLESDDKIKYKLYRNRITSLTRLSKKMYFHSYFQQGINMLISNNKKSRKSITNLKDPSTNKLAYKRNEVANILNKHFATIGQKLSSYIPDSSTQFTEFLRGINVNESFFFNPVTPEEVERTRNFANSIHQIVWPLFFPHQYFEVIEMYSEFSTCYYH